MKIRKLTGERVPAQYLVMKITKILGSKFKHSRIADENTLRP